MSNRIVGIDVLRATAVLIVICFHSLSHNSSAFLGVDIFFVISGYVITRSSLFSISKFTKPINYLANFFKKRILRILPPLLTTAIISSLFASLFVYDESTVVSLGVKTYLYSFFGLSNIFLAFFQPSYFSPASESNFALNTWSLGIEDQFYILFPLFFAFSYFIGTRIKHSFFYLLCFFFVSSLLLYLRYNHTSLGFYLLPFRSWELAFGCLLAYTHSQFKSVRGFLSSLGYSPKILSFLYFLINCFFISLNFLPESRLLAIPVVLATGLALIISVTLGDKLLHPFSTSLAYLGRISYSLYLIHWPVFVLASEFFDLSPLTYLPLFLITFALSFIQYRYIETPFINSFVNLKTILLYAGSSVLIFALDAYHPIHNNIYLGSRRPHKDKLYSSTNWSRENCYATNSTTPLSSNKLDNCWYSLPATTSHSPTTHSRSFWFGDSYAEQLSSFIRSSKGAHWFAVAGGCPISNSLNWNTQCNVTVSELYDYVSKHAQSGDKVFLALAYDPWDPTLPSRNLDPRNNQPISSSKAWNNFTNSLTEFSNLVSSKGATVYVLGSVPVLNNLPSNCSSWFHSFKTSCQRNLDASNSWRKNYDRSLLKLSKKYPFEFVDLHSLVAPFIDTSNLFVYYWDKGHLSNEGIDHFLVPSFVSKSFHL